jgi:hypothetical protein
MAVSGVGVLLAAILCAGADETQDRPKSATEIIEALKDLNLLVGDWRGVGQPKRGSQQGAWQERGACVWELTKERCGLRWKADGGKLWRSAFISYSPAEEEFTLTLELPDESQRRYAGNYKDTKFVVESDVDAAGDVHRLTLSVLNENRLTVLFEKRTEKQTFYSRVAEIGFQRQGTKLAATDGSGPECVVTGGKGTIPVTYQGKTYYVCCTGCRDAFNDDPEGILAAWAEKKKTKK